MPASVTPQRLTMLAAEARDGLLRHQVPLNESIQKLAEREELGPHHVQRVCEAANKMVTAALRKVAKDKSFTFKVASYTDVMSGIKGVPPTEIVPLDKIAAVLTPVRDPRVAEALEHAHKTAAAAVNAIPPKELYARLHRLHEKTAAYITEYEMDLVGLQGERNAALDGICKEAHSRVMGGDTLQDMTNYAVGCGYAPHQAVALFTHVKQALSKLGHPVDEKLINMGVDMPDGNVRVVNGRTVLRVLLDTLKNKISAEDECSQRLHLMGTFGDASIKMMKQLQSSEDFYNDVHDLYSKLAFITATPKPRLEQYLRDHAEELRKIAATVPSPATAVGSGVRSLGRATATLVPKTLWKLRGPIAVGALASNIQGPGPSPQGDLAAAISRRTT